MLYTIDSQADEPILLINTHIGVDPKDGPGIIGATFQQELLQLDSLKKKRLQVWINSPGGDVQDGYAIYNAILKSSTPVDTYCVGMAASIAGVIFQAGRKRIMADYAILMYHNPFIPKDNVSDTGKNMLQVMHNSIIKMISTRCSLSESEVGALMDRTTFIEAAEAKQKGLCDEVESSSDSNLKYVRKEKATNSLAYYKGYQQVLNKLVSNTHTLSVFNNTAIPTTAAAIQKSIANKISNR